MTISEVPAEAPPEAPPPAATTETTMVEKPPPQPQRPLHPAALNDEDSYFAPAGFETTINRIFSIYGQQLRTFVTISVLSVGLRYLLAFITDVVNGPDLDVDYNMEDLPEWSSLDSWATFTMYVVENFIFYLTICLNDGAIVQAVAELYAGQQSTSTTALAHIGTAAFKLGPLIGSCLLIFLMLLVPAFLLVFISYGLLTSGTNPYVFIVLIMLVIAVYVSLITFFVYPCIMVENATATGSIGRSYELTQGYLCDILGISSLFGFFKGICATFISCLEVVDSTAAHVIAQILFFGLAVLFASLLAIMKAVVYFNVRVRKEDFTQEQLAREMGLTDNQYIELSSEKNEVSEDTKQVGEIV